MFVDSVLDVFQLAYQSVRAQITWKDASPQARVRHMRSAMFLSFVWLLDKYDMYTAEVQKIFTFGQMEYGDLYQVYGIESPSDFR